MAVRGCCAFAYAAPHKGRGTHPFSPLALFANARTQPLTLTLAAHKAFNAKNGTSLAPRPYKNETEAEVTAYLCACGK